LNGFKTSLLKKKTPYLFFLLKTWHGIFLLEDQWDYFLYCYYFVCFQLSYFKKNKNRIWRIFTC
jgi:hypothetical protein